jgi:hypothetical protein
MKPGAARVVLTLAEPGIEPATARASAGGVNGLTAIEHNADCRHRARSLASSLLGHCGGNQRYVFAP